MGKSETRFFIKLPPGWEDQTVYHFRGPEVDGRDHLLLMVVDRHPQTNDIKDFAAARTRPIIENLQGLEILKDEETTVPGCYPTYEFVYRWIPADGVKFFKKHVFVLHGDFGYSYEIEFTKKTYKILGGQIRKVINDLLPGSFEPED
jgi:hypothetical protein